MALLIRILHCQGQPQCESNFSKNWKFEVFCEKLFLKQKKSMNCSSELKLFKPILFNTLPITSF